MSNNLYDVTVTEFSTYLEAKKHIPEGSMLLGNMSKFCTKLLASHMKDFSNVEYTRKQLSEIMDNKDVETFQKIFPLYLKGMNMQMTKEQEEFFVENITANQLSIMPTNVLKEISIESLYKLSKRIMDEGFSDVKHKTCYIIHMSHVKEPNQKYMYCVVLDNDLKHVIHSQILYVRKWTRATYRRMDYQTLVSYPSVSLKDIADYLSVSDQFVKLAYFTDEDSLFAKCLKPADSDKTLDMKVDYRVTTESFKELLKDMYSNKDEYKVANSGLYEWKELARKFNMEDSLVERTVRHGCKTGILNYYTISERMHRFSIEDFEKYIKNRKIRPAYSRSVIEFPLNITQKAKDKILSEYIEERELYNRLSFSLSDVNTVSNYRSLTMIKETRQALTLYTYRGGKHSYYKKSEVNEFVSGMYGTEKKGVFTSGRKFNINLVKDVMRAKAVIDVLVERYPVLSRAEITDLFNTEIEKGYIPYINAGERRHLFILSDVLKVMDKKVANKD